MVLLTNITSLEGKRREEKRNVIFTIKIKEDGEEKYIGDFDIFRRILREETIKTFFISHGVESRGEGICSLCGKKEEVYGFASPFSFYTVDKKGFAPQFLREASWKQLPICEDCAVSLVGGKKFLDNYLLKRFYGYQFYIIPFFTFGDIRKEVIETIKDSEKREYTKSLLGEEDDILDLLKEENDVITFAFVFLRPKQKYFDIVKYVEEVPPSWIKNLFDVFGRINQKSIFREDLLRKLLGNDWVGDFKDGIWKGKRRPLMDMAGMIRTFFPPSKETGVHDKYFLDIIGDILAQRPLRKDLLINAFLREMRNRHVNQKEWEEKLLSTKSLYLLTFINELGLIEGNDKMSEEIEERGIESKPEKEAERVESFFSEFENAFGKPDKKAVFLEGILAKFLLDVQRSYYKGSSAPFRSKLHGLKLDKRMVRKLLPEMVEKLAQYKDAKNYPEYPWLKELLSKYLLEADNSGWELSNDEISYYFALGLNLGGIFKEKEEEKRGGEEK